MRDVFRLFDMRLHLMLDEDDPTFANWDQDETAVAERYGEQDPVTVGRDVVAAGNRIADSFAAVTRTRRVAREPAAMEPASPWRRSPAISSTIRCITCGT